MGRDVGRAALLLHPSEGSRASKTGEYDETVVVDDPQLVKALTRLKAVRPPNALLIGCLPEQFWLLFQEAIVFLKIDKVLGHQVPYVLRHTGASADAWAKRRDLPTIQSRGRWKGPNSVRRYAKGGRVAHQLSLCSAQMVQYGERSVRLLELVFTRQREPLRPPTQSAL